MIKSQVAFQLLFGVGISNDTLHLCQTQPSFVAMYCSCEWGATCCCNSKLKRKPAIGVNTTSSLIKGTNYSKFVICACAKLFEGAQYSSH